MKSSVLIHESHRAGVLKGHPWIYPKGLSLQNHEPNPGEMVSLYDNQANFIGLGAYNPNSLYRVRVLGLSPQVHPHTTLEELIKQKLNQALMIRQALNLPNQNTTAYRFFNSEADGLSGLTIDRFDSTCVIASSAYWVESSKEMILNALTQIFPHDALIWFPQIKPLKQDGFCASEPEVDSREVIVKELGVQFYINFASAQKTGLFIDQRENHARIAQLAKGKRVLDLYSYTGGFALHAALNGAKYVCAVDSSAAAIEAGERNALLNRLDNIEWVKADARNYLGHAKDFDIVTLDPPKLVPSKKHLAQAKNYYRFLHLEVFKALKPGSLLMTCNCSSALTSQAFAELVYTQAQKVGKQAKILGIYGPAACHPTLPVFPEGQYLTSILVGVV